MRHRGKHQLVSVRKLEQSWYKREQEVTTKETKDRLFTKIIQLPGVQDWNSLPNNIRTINSPTTFKTHLRAIM